MEISGARVLILGGSGLVGTAIARELLPYRPEAVAVSALGREEAEQAAAELRLEPGCEGVEVAAEWGDIFLPERWRERKRSDLLADPEARPRLIDELFGPLGDEQVEGSAFAAALRRHRPSIVVDCVNTATVFAYQDLFASAATLRRAAAAGEAGIEQVERQLGTLYLPQLIRHVQIALEAMKRASVRNYLKIGTAGTGGMGLNVPFTHSEERPSRTLLSKASLAGAHSLLLFLMARTPGAPAVAEIKPTAAISWKKIARGTVTRAGRPIPLVDATGPVAVAEGLAGGEGEGAWRETGEALRGVYLDAGENGLFSLGEFEALTSLGLMEFITPEEIAQDAVRELLGHPTGRNVVAALDGATSGPTYRAGVLRQSAISRMEELEREEEGESVAYEMLGPPRLSKLLFEAHLAAQLSGGLLESLASSEARELAERAWRLVQEDAALRTRILSIGLPILLPDGERLLRGREVKVLAEPGEEPDLDRLAARGVVDLRPANWSRWVERARTILDGVKRRGGGAESGSRYDLEGWEGEGKMRPGALAAWVFREEDGGKRIKR